jgi:hypothetical protein
MRRNRFLTSALALAIAIAASDLAKAWGPEGHAIVADIAEAHLTPAAAAQVGNLLSLERHHRLDEVASWADEIRPQRRDTASWHFVDIPLASSNYDATRDCANGNCVVAKIVDFAVVLANPSADEHARLEALKWVVRLVGDIHQPLHAEDDKHGRGGNAVKLTYFGRSTNLHAIWDGAIIEHAMGLQLGPHFRFNHEAVATEAHKLDARFSASQRHDWASAGLLSRLQPAVITWAIEAHGVAQTVAYAGLPSNRTREWSIAYQAQVWPVVQIQLEKAAVRLAEVLNEALQ